MEVEHVLHTRQARRLGNHALVVLRILQFDAIGILHLIDGQRIEQRRICIGALVIVVRILLGFVENLLDVRVLLQSGADVLRWTSEVSCPGSQLPD